MADPWVDINKLPDDVKIRLAELELELSEGKWLPLYADTPFSLLSSASSHLLSSLHIV
jgi:hypothetical protein